MTEWLREVRYGIRVLARTPAFTTVAVLSLALGIGVNTAVLAVGRAVLMTPLPVPDPDRLAVACWWRGDTVKGMMNINSGGARDERTARALSTNYDYGTYVALRQALRDRADLFAFTFVREANLSFEGQSVVGGGMLVSGNYFSTMGVPMQIGRGLHERDDRPDAEPVAVLGFGMWRRAFGGDAAIVGRTMRANGRAFTVVGVTAPDYFGVSNGGFFPPADITFPLSAQPMVSPRWNALMGRMNPPATGSLFTTDRIQWLRVMARLKPGVDRAQLEPLLAAALMQRLNTTSHPVAPGAEPPAVRLLDGARGLDSMRASLETPLFMLGGVAALVFLIACVNIASMVLVRGVARQREFWIRLALGAGRARLVRQTIVECFILAGAGGTLGIVLSVWAGRTMVATMAGSTPNALAVRVDPVLIMLAAAVSCLAAVLFGIFPALRLASRGNADFMRQAGAGVPRLRAGSGLVVAQVAIAVPLVVGAALFLRTVHNLASVDPGFDPRGLILFKMDPTLNGYDEARARQLYARAIDHVGALPGVRGATLVENPLISGITSSTTFGVDDAKPKSMLMNRVGAGFFDTIGVAVIAGRGLGLQDHATAPRVGVINESAVRAFFDGGNPLGRVMKTSAVKEGAVEIVGVVRDSRYRSLKQDPSPTIYLPYEQSSGMGAMFVAVRAGVLTGLPEQVRRAVAEVDPDIPITGLKTQTQQIDETVGSERALTLLLVFFGVFALVLACIGLHGVTAYAVARRTSEIGIRLALGAQRGNVVWLILRQVLLLAGAGLLIGVPAAAFGSRALQAFLFGVEPADPWSVTAGALVLFGAVILAGFIPARKASRLDPLVALRRE
ncbi:MAG TPA: ABC transporter permease [Vicinamibacterales bacterium]|nr:ABC transporter permease [Vicinamibacterales bacterium]